MDNHILGLTSCQQLSVICMYASKHRKTMRIKGTGSSLSRNTPTCHILIDMTSLNRIITPRPVTPGENQSKEFVDIEVEGGMKVVHFVEELDKYYELGLPVVGSYAGQTIAGAVTMSCHGSGLGSAAMTTSVVGLHMILSTGIQVKIGLGPETLQSYEQKLASAQPSGNPVVISSTFLLAAAVVSLGSIGIIYSLTIRCIPVYNLREERSVVKIPWRSKEPFSIMAKFGMTIVASDFFSLVINPYPQPQGYLYAAVFNSKPTSSEPVCCQPCTCWCGSGGRGCTDCFPLQTTCCYSCLQCSFARCCRAGSRDLINYGLSYYDLTKPFVHKWYNVLQLTRRDVRTRTSEWCLPLTNVDNALADVIDTAVQFGKQHNQYSILPLRVRFSRTDDVPLSPSFKQFGTNTTGRCCFIEVPLLAATKDATNEEYLREVSSTMINKYGARPHWGKENQLTAEQIKTLYPNFGDWKKAYNLLNPNGIFRSNFSEKMGFSQKVDQDDEGIRLQSSESTNIITVQPEQ